VSDTETASEFVISRTVNARLARVWRAWTDPDEMAQWWGPKGFKADVKRFDLRPGGMFHYLLTSPQAQEMWGRFVFRAIVPEERLVFISSFSDSDGGLTRHPLHEGWPLQMLSTITFTEIDGKTTVTVKWAPYEASDSEREIFEKGKDSMQAGWTGTFEKLESHLANT
jgi:uncharacterized protein YndB with AHSA1/START domain